MKVDDLELMLLHDGELDAAREQRIRAARLHSAELGQRLEALSSMGSLVREWAVIKGVDVARERRQLVLRKRRRTLLAAFSAAAACLVCWAGTSGPIRSADAVAEAESGPVRENEPVALAALSKHSERSSVSIESVDFGLRAGAIFLVETESAPTTVVWLPDGPEAGRIGTL
jgi:hypothetical protein